MQFPEGVSLVYSEDLRDSNFEEFAENLRNNGIPALATSRPESGPYACIEWLIPTAIIAGVSAGFLNEAGKELFQLLKRKLSDLTIETIKKPRIEPVMLGTEEKISKDNPYSSAFSIYSEASMGRRFKLLIPKYSRSIDYNRIVYAYLDFLKDYNYGVVTEADIGLKLSRTLGGGGN